MKSTEEHAFADHPWYNTSYIAFVTLWPQWGKWNGARYVWHEIQKHVKPILWQGWNSFYPAPVHGSILSGQHFNDMAQKTLSSSLSGKDPMLHFRYVNTNTITVMEIHSKIELHLFKSEPLKNLRRTVNAISYRFASTRRSTKFGKSSRFSERQLGTSQ